MPAFRCFLINVFDIQEPGHCIKDLVLLEGLAHQLITAGLQDLVLLLYQDAGRDRHNLDRLASRQIADLLGGRIPIQHRHTHVHPDQMGTPFLKECDGHFTVFGLFHRESDLGE